MKRMKASYFLNLLIKNVYTNINIFTIKNKINFKILNKNCIQLLW